MQSFVLNFLALAIVIYQHFYEPVCSASTGSFVNLAFVFIHNPHSSATIRILLGNF